MPSSTPSAHPQKPRVLTAADFVHEETYRATRAPVTLASTIVPDAYRSAEFHRLELERVWSGGWVCVGYTSQVANPGDNEEDPGWIEALKSSKPQAKPLVGGKQHKLAEIPNS